MEISPNFLKYPHRDQWRHWLEENSASQKEAWVILYKKKYQHLGLNLDETIEEALCFGWIDGIMKSIDEKTIALRFSPRRKNSVWSMSNIQRVEKLIAAGKMTAAGELKIAEARENGQWDDALRREQVDIIPKDLERALRDKPGALSAYQALSDSRKKQYIYWLQSAKREDTKRKRIQKILEEVAKK